MRQAARVAVVGAGVVGLSTAAALLDVGAEVRLYERDAPGRAQSVGDTRVFRLAHGEARLVELAARAERLWRTWEDRFRRRLVSHEGLIITGDETVSAWTRAMADAGAPHELLSVEEARNRLPIARPVGSAALFDPAAGPTRAQRTVDCLLAVCEGSLRLEEVAEVGQSAAGCTVTTASGRWECDEVVIAAGVETGRLAAQVGIGVEADVVPDSRFSYAIAPEYRRRPLPCWFDRSEAYGPGFTSYGQRVGSSNLYAVAVGSGEVAGLSPEEESAQHRQTSLAYIPQAYPGLNPVPEGEIRCLYPVYGFGDDGDGFMARRSGGITALYGRNLFKFAPLVGQLLCQTALKGELVDELVPYPLTTLTPNPSPTSGRGETSEAASSSMATVADCDAALPATMPRPHSPSLLEGEGLG